MKDDWIESFFPMRDGKMDWSLFAFSKDGPMPLYCWDNEPLLTAHRKRITDRLTAVWQRLTPAGQQAARTSSILLRNPGS
jgi:hypothetical protein